MQAATVLNSGGWYWSSVHAEQNGCAVKQCLGEWLVGGAGASYYDYYYYYCYCYCYYNYYCYDYYYYYNYSYYSLCWETKLFGTKILPILQSCPTCTTCAREDWQD